MTLSREQSEALALKHLKLNALVNDITRLSNTNLEPGDRAYLEAFEADLRNGDPDGYYDKVRIKVDELLKKYFFHLR